MADINRSSAYPGQGYRANLFSDVNSTYEKGAIVVFKANGAIHAANDVDGEKTAGIVMENTVVTGGSGYVPVLCRSRVWFGVPSHLSGRQKIGTFFRATHTGVRDSTPTKERVGLVIATNRSPHEVFIDMDWIS